MSPRMNTSYRVEQRTITASIALGDDGGLPTSIEWIPAGSHDVWAARGGKPELVHVNVTGEVADLLNAQLQTRITASNDGNASRPYIDFDHEHGRAAALPVRFYWDDGVRLEVQWTASGAEAVKGRDYSYFSPEFHVDDSGNVTAIPEHGPIGALVNTPAFQTIERLAAALNQNQETMNIEEQLKAAQAEVANLTKELEAVKASLSSTQADRAELKASLESATATIEASRKASIEAEIDALVAANRVTPEGKGALISACLASADNGKALLAAIPQVISHRAGQPLQVRASQSQPESSAARCAAVVGKTI